MVYTPLPTLNCDPYGYLVQFSSFYRVNITSGSVDLVKQTVGDGSRNIQAIGYNVADNFIYGSWGTTLNSPCDLIRIAGNGDMTNLKSLNISSKWYPNAGDVDDSSQYWATYLGTYWMQVDLRPTSTAFATTVTSGYIASPPHYVLDWAFVPGGGNYLYGLGYDQQSAGDLHTYLQRFDRTTKTWSVIADLGNVIASGKNRWGAAYSSEDGYLYGSENGSGQIWKFNIPPNGDNSSFVPTSTFLAAGPTAGQNDGARCNKAKF